MEFDEILAQVIELLQRQGRISYGALKRRFHLDDEYLQDLKDELIDAQRVARDEDGKVLVWTGKDTEDEKAKGAKREKENDSELRTPNSQTRDLRRQTPESAAERRQLTVMFCDLGISFAVFAQECHGPIASSMIVDCVIKRLCWRTSPWPHLACHPVGCLS